MVVILGVTSLVTPLRWTLSVKVSKHVEANQQSRIVPRPGPLIESNSAWMMPKLAPVKELKLELDAVVPPSDAGGSEVMRPPHAQRRQPRGTENWPRPMTWKEGTVPTGSPSHSSATYQADDRRGRDT